MNRNTILGILVIVAFMLLIVSIPMYFEYERQSKRFSIDSPDFEKKTQEEIVQIVNDRRANNTDGKSPIQTSPIQFMIPFFSFIGLAVGAVVYYLMSEQVETKEKKIQTTVKIAKKNTKIILKFLNKQERNVVEKLMENGGKMRQYELSYLPELGKVRTHRILKNLETKGVISREKFGKVNKIALNKELYEVLKE
jgi:uncharacterized membrane protein